MCLLGCLLAEMLVSKVEGGAANVHKQVSQNLYGI